MELSNQIKAGKVEFPKKYWEGISEDAIDLCKKLLTVDSTKRYSMNECLTHSWLRVCLDHVEKMIILNFVFYRMMK